MPWPSSHRVGRDAVSDGGDAMSALILTLECATTREPHRQIEIMGGIARHFEVLSCATINGVFVSVGWTQGSVQAAKDKYDRDYKRLPEHRKKFSIVSHTASVILFAVAFGIVVKGLMA